MKMIFAELGFDSSGPIQHQSLCREPIMAHSFLDPCEKMEWNSVHNTNTFFLSRTCSWNCHLQRDVHFFSLNVLRRIPSGLAALHWATWSSKHGWELLSQFPPFLYFSMIFLNHRNFSYLSNIMFIFDRCRRSSAVVTPAKYERG